MLQQPLRRVVMLSYAGGNLIDIGGPIQVYASANRALIANGRQPAYEILVASEHGGALDTGCGLPIVTTALRDIVAGPIDTLLIPGGSPDSRPVVEPALVHWIRTRGADTRRLCSVCTGAFLLAATGLLDGLRATTHWQWAARLQAMHPSIKVDADPIFIREGRIWTSAGVTAGIDLALALIEQDLGHRLAIDVARNLVMFIKRPGSQSQFSVPLLAQSVAPARFAELHAWIASHLNHDLRIERLAEEAGMAPRSFARAYVAEVGRTPAKTVEMMRFEAACRALEETILPLKRVAFDVGYGDEQNLRRVFQRRLRISPAQYRERFSAHPEAKPVAKRRRKSAKEGPAGISRNKRPVPTARPRTRHPA
jgi:transcriptional regulator GlxA family with amidase domain